MSPVQECFQLTKQLLELAQKPVNEEEREGVIEQIEGMLERREQLLSAIQPPFTDEEQQMGKQMVEWNRLLNEFLKKMQLQIQADIQETKKKKTSVRKYVNPYESLQSDGVFYDKRN